MDNKYSKDNMDTNIIIDDNNYINVSKFTDTKNGDEFFDIRKFSKYSVGGNNDNKLKPTYKGIKCNISLLKDMIMALVRIGCLSGLIHKKDYYDILYILKKNKNI